MSDVPNSFLDAAVGVGIVNETVKALQLLIAGSATACFAAYLWPVVRDVREHPLVSRFLVWSLLFAGAQIPCFVPLLVAYLFRGIDPTSVPGLPDELRLIYLAALHTALVGRWAEAEPERFGVRLVTGSLVSFTVAVATFLFLPYRG